jgi:hypothetical protein
MIVPWPLELLNHLGRLNLLLCFIVVVVYVSLILSFHLLLSAAK